MNNASTGRRSPFEFSANPRVLASVRTAVGAVALLKGVSLLVLGGPSAVVTAAWLALSLAVTIGWRARAAALALFLGAWYLMLLDEYWSHLVLLSAALLLVSVSDCQRNYAVRPRGTGSIAGWPLLLMRGLVSIVYLFAGLRRINSDFLSGGVLREYAAASIWPLPELTRFLVPASFSAVAILLFVGSAVWSTRLRPIVFALALPLHAAAIAVAVNTPDLVRIGTSSILMLVLFAAFLDVPERGRLVVWDDSCSFCLRWVTALQRLDVFSAFHFLGLSEPDGYLGAGVREAAALEAIQLVQPDGGIRAGYSAVRGIVSVLPGGCFIAPYMAFPGVPVVGDRVYRRVALRRTCTYIPRDSQA